MSSNLKVLVADDTFDHVQIISQILKQELKAEVESATTGEECLKKVKEQSFDLLLLDYLLPEISGLDVLKKITQAGYDLPVIMITGHGNERIAVEAMKAGAIDYIVKSEDGFEALPSVAKKAIEKNLLKKRLRESEEKFKNLFENANDGIVYLDIEGRIMEVNRKALQIFGGEKQEVVGKHFARLGIFSRMEIPMLMRNFINILAQRETTHEICIKNKKGEKVALECSASVIKTDGKITDIMVIARDITERKKAEEEIRKLSQYLESVIDNANVWLDVLDEKGNVVIWNKAAEQISGYTRKEVVGHHKIWEWLYPDENYRERIIEKAVAIIEKGEVMEDSETTIRCKNGEKKTISWNSRNLLGADGKPIGSIALGRDVTERKKLLQKLIQSEKLAAVGTLAYGIAHEFNNILAGMMMNAEFGSSLSNNPQIKECFEAIAENCQRGSSITNNLLAMAGERKEKKEMIDITKSLENVLSFVHRELEKANIKTVTDFKTVPEIFADPGEFSEIFLNLINNAKDAMYPEGGTLTIKVAPHEDNIRIVFKDTGCGIPDQIKEKIFDPFVTTKGALGKSEIPGTGLGLFLTYGIINSYHGKIEVDSKVGKGTKFTIQIPISGNLPPESTFKKERISFRGGERKLKILLIDDEKTICNVLKKFLESKGHKVTASFKAKEGFKHFKKENFDVILSDITMPGMDGVELIREMKEKNKRSKIIAITGHIRKQKMDQAKKAGADKVLIKPFKNELLYRTIIQLTSG